LWSISLMAVTKTHTSSLNTSVIKTHNVKSVAILSFFTFIAILISSSFSKESWCSQFVNVLLVSFRIRQILFYQICTARNNIVVRALLLSIIILIIFASLVYKDCCAHIKCADYLNNIFNVVPGISSCYRAGAIAALSAKLNSMLKHSKVIVVENRTHNIYIYSFFYTIDIPLWCSKQTKPNNIKNKITDDKLNDRLLLVV